MKTLTVTSLLCVLLLCSCKKTNITPTKSYTSIAGNWMFYDSSIPLKVYFTLTIEPVSQGATSNILTEQTTAVVVNGDSTYNSPSIMAPQRYADSLGYYPNLGCGEAGYMLQLSGCSVDNKYSLITVKHCILNKTVGTYVPPIVLQQPITVKRL